MKKVIVLSTVLGLSALGMACGDSANTNVTVKPANVSTPVSVSTPAPISTPPSNMATPGNSTMKPSTSPAMKTNMATPPANVKKP